MNSHSIGDLNKLWDDAEQADFAIFSEMRSNILLHSGDHYKKTAQRLNERLGEKVPEETKLRLTKNHTQVVTNTYISNIVSQTPGVRVLPFNAKEPQDQKDAELSQAVWSDAEIKQDIEGKIETWAQDFIVPGECAARIYWDPNKGQFKGYNQKVDKEGNPLFIHPKFGDIPHGQDLDGTPLQPTPDFTSPVFTGMLCVEVIHAYNLMRDKQAESLLDSPWLGYRRMVQIEDAKQMLANLPQEERERKEQYLTESGKTTFKVFDSTTGEYSDSKGQVMFREYYFRPCSKYPKGYFYISTENGILFDGELPYGIFPIIVEGFNKIPSSPRHRSIIKQIRGPQAQINMIGSMQGTTILTLGQDKIITQAGSKLQRGVNFAGIREFQVAGPAPTVLPGRSGDHLEGVLSREIAELYKLANLEYESQESQGTDIQAMLFKSLSQRKKYARYAKKFERFLSNVAKTYLMLAKRYLPDDYLINAVGKREQINLAEFRDISDEGFNIKLKPITGDVESLLGMQFNLSQTLQYVGKELPKEEIGRLIRRMPFLSQEEAVDYLTIDDECVEADILAMDRGSYRPAQPEDNHDIYIKRLSHRMKQNDFEFLSPKIQQAYVTKKQEHEQLKSQQLQELQAAQSGFIPSGGAAIKLDVYGPDGKRMTVPYESAQWLVQRLQQQGLSQEALQMQDQQTQLEILKTAIDLNQQNGMGPQAVGMQQPMPPMPQ